VVDHREGASGIERCAFWTRGQQCRQVELGDHLFVADTGNARIVQFNTGEFQLGGSAG
jgi:hypothetical protein